jgi:hypothetical protein
MSQNEKMVQRGRRDEGEDRGGAALAYTGAE